MILQVLPSLVAYKLTISVQVEHYQCGDPADAVSLLQILDSLFIGEGYGWEGHGGKVSLEVRVVAVIRAEYYLHTLLSLVHVLVKLDQSWCEKATGRCPVSAEIDAQELRLACFLH